MVEPEPLPPPLEEDFPAQAAPQEQVKEKSGPAARPRIKEFEVMVAEVIRETPDTVTLVLFTGNDRLEYQPGHFLTIRPQQFPALERFCRFFEDLKGKKEPARAYSLTSAPHEQQLAITIKEELYISGQTKYPPLLSPFLVWNVQPGLRMAVTGFGGPYVLSPDVESRTDHVVHICAGSGIVPNFSIIKHCLANGMKLRHTLIYGNKTWDDIIFRRQLEELAAAYPGQLNVVHALSRQSNLSSLNASIWKGRICEELIRQHLDDPTGVEVYACGPAIGKFERLAAKEKGEEPQPRFLETTLAALGAIGVPKDRIHYESYG